MPFGIQEAVFGCAGEHTRSVLLRHVVANRQHHAVERLHAHIHRDAVVERRRRQILAVHRRHGRNHPAALQFRIREAELFQIRHARFLHEADIIRVVRHAHAVGFIILHPMC